MYFKLTEIGCHLARPAPAAKPALAHDETIINPFYMCQLLKHAYQRAQQGMCEKTEEELLEHATVSNNTMDPLRCRINKVCPRLLSRNSRVSRQPQPHSNLVLYYTMQVQSLGQIQLDRHAHTQSEAQQSPGRTTNMEPSFSNTTQRKAKASKRVFMANKPLFSSMMTFFSLSSFVLFQNNQSLFPLPFGSNSPPFFCCACS